VEELALLSVVDFGVSLDAGVVDLLEEDDSLLTELL